jgi:hypothetical protein
VLCSVYSSQHASRISKLVNAESLRPKSEAGYQQVSRGYA